MESGESRSGWLRECVIANVRSFGPEPETLSLLDREGQPAQWTLILGNNGAGKSGLLLSLAIALQTLFLKREYSRVDFAGISLLGPSTTPETPSLVRLNYGADRSETVNISHFDSTSGPTTFAMFEGPANEPFPLPLAYGPNRISTEEVKTLQESVWGIGHLLYLTNGLRSPNKLLVNNRHLFQAGQTHIDFASILSKALPDDITVGFQEGAAQGNVSAFSELTPVFNTPTGPVPFAQLGYGYKTIVALVSDIASRMIEGYPSSTNALQETAICLIDELDLHLHPSWQRKLVTYLGDTFPNTQFIATAHSPLIVQAAEGANLALVRLSDELEGSFKVSRINNDVEQIRGWRLDQVITSDLFGFESPYAPAIEEKVRAQDSLRAKAELTGDEAIELEKLDVELKGLPAGETYEQAKALLKLSEDSIRLLEEARAPEASA